MNITAHRRESVENARKAWIKRLIDLSRRNNLLYYRSLKLGTLNLSLVDSDRWAALLRGDSVSMHSLLSDTPGEDLSPKILGIWRRAQENLEEKGLATNFVALGMASWKAEDGGRDSDAPVLLMPVAIELKGHSTKSASLHRTGPVQTNIVLLHILEEEFGITIPPETVLSKLQGNEEGEVFDPSAVYEFLYRECASLPEFKIRNVAVLGNFAFQKMAMVRDLQGSTEQLVANDLIAALSGDTDARQSVGGHVENPDPKEFDKLLPQDEFLILDADSSQQSAIAAVLAGQSAVIHGPPGTGKSQTIANLVASLAARGYRVLFVAEKRAALQVVLKRLQQVGLDRIAIDLHGADISPKRVMDQVSAALTSVRQAALVDCSRMHAQYVERRGRLNRHVQALHLRRKPSEMSVYEMQGILLRLQTKVQSETRWRGQELLRIDKAGVAQIRDLLREAGGFASLFLRTDPSPWNGVSLRDGESAQAAVDLVARLSSQTWPSFTSSVTGLVEAIGFQAPKTLRTAQEMYSLLSTVRKTLEVYSDEIFKQDIQGLIRGLQGGKTGGFKAFWAWCTSSDFRRKRKDALSYRRAGKTSSRELFVELTAIENQRIQWGKWRSHPSMPNALPNYSDAEQRLEAAAGDLAGLNSIITRKQSDSLPLAEVGTFVDSLAKDRLTPMKLPRLHRIESHIAESGVGKLVEEFRKNKSAPEIWIPSFDQAWYGSCLEASQAEDPGIAGFNGRTHDEFVREFKELDKERVRISSARVRRTYAERAISVMNLHKDQELVIRSEAEKKRRHRPLRALFAEARDVLTAVCPCWMASPLSVSQLLDTAPCFDFVIFDEASQILPEDAIPAIMRGANLVVAGDRWQLPPTTFFAAADDEELAADESGAATEGYESLLDTSNAFMASWYLDWHYRSRDEALISFSNHHIYKDRLITFPGPGGDPVIRHILVEQTLGFDGQEESSAAEVSKVVELILDHAEKRPQESLGVIAMGIRHADRVQRALDQAIAMRPELGHFFDATVEERFFVKNLERVQGDERDAIILTVGYGKDRAGNLPFRFGPLLSLGGQRRLNVAVTRARKRMSLISSFSHLDMNLEKVKAGTGVEMLRNYLEYAASGGKRLGQLASADFPMNSFEAEVFDVLESKGIPLISQVGASSYRIDLVAQHPRERGRYVLAIECDGASYHSSPTARDRDRLRQQQLENLGWRFHRIWSTDWFMRKEEEIARALAAYENAVSSIDNSDSIDESRKEMVSGQQEPLSPNQRNRSARPSVGRRQSITDYSRGELEAMIAWIESDGNLRTDEEIIEELIPSLGFHHRGNRIEGTLKSALEMHRNRQSIR